MKIQKLISKGLVLGFLFNSASILSYATTEIPNRYQILEGEYTSIDNPTESSIEEIEVFGNTVQDPNNLEDIQSVGNLYVDDDGSPILDKQGREQYKIDIFSVGKNIFNINNIEFKNCAPYIQHSIDDGVLELMSINPTYNGFITKDGLLFEDGIQYTLSYDIETNEIGDLGVTAQIVDEDGLHYTVRNGKSITFIANGKMSLRFYTNVGEYSGTIIRKFSNIQIEKGPVKTNYEFYKKNIVELLLPTQLERVGQVSDKLYYDKIKKTWCIEKNISQHIFKDDSFYINEQLEDFTTGVYKIENLKCGWGENTVLINGKRTKGNVDWNKLENRDIYTTSDSLVVLYPKGTTYKEINDDMNGRKLRLVTETPSKIILPKSTQIALNSFLGATYIFTNNESVVKPTLKVIVDKIIEITKNTVEDAKLEKSLSKITLARMYVNMLPESLYKDQLQEQLNQLFTTDMVLEKKNTTANVDLYIKCENMLLMSLDTNSITFDDFSGVTDMEKTNSVNITVTSSLPYQLNAYLPTEIQNSDKTNTMDKEILNIKENGESAYQTFVNTLDKIVLKDNCIAGNDINHGVDIKLKGSIAHEKDVYKTTIKFEVQQK